MLSEFLGWVLRTVTTAAEAEMNDDTALREQLLEAELRREMGEISESEFADIEADLLARIREIRTRREGGSGAFTMSGQPLETTADSRFEIEATVTGDFHEPSDAPALSDAPQASPAARRSGKSRTSGSRRSRRSL